MKKTICLLLAFAAMLTAVSCGEGSGGDTSEAPQSGGGTSSGGEETAAAEETSGSADVSSQPEGEESLPGHKPYIDGKKLVVFGDSITALGSWGRTAAEELNMRFYNGAMGGITSAQGIDRFPAYVASRSADYVTLLFGMNDLIMVTDGNPRVTPEQFGKNMTRLVEMVRECGAVPILLTANPLDPNKFWSAQGQSKTLYESVGGDPLAWLEVYNDVTRKVASETGAYLVDMYKACEGVAYTDLLYDGIHLSSKGNRIFAETLTAWFKDRFDNDPEAAKVSDETGYIEVTGESGKASLCSFDPSSWYTADASLMTITNADGAIRLTNTNGLWPYAEYLPSTPLMISVADGYLYFDISTANVGASILLFFDGSTPSAYTEGTYLSINRVIGAKYNEVGDIVANQTLKGSVKLSDIGIPAKSVKDGKVLITGLKVFVAGNAGQPVTLRELSVGY